MAGGVVDLPAALAPWSRELAIFPREIALELGPVVRRLAALVGSAIPSRAASGEPDGFDGLARRGSYERLLHSEWLLADELPEEFARRAAMHEHLFLAVARQQRVQHPLAVALFDCGPSQLGTPRLAHIAALVVLARRAAAAEAAFRWGVLQNPDRLFDDITTANVGYLLEARTALEATESHIDAWLEALDAGHGLDVGELWFAGPSRLARFPGVRRQWHLEIEDALDLKEQLRAAVRHDARHDPPVLLDLPSAEVCTRLLRDPFTSRVAPLATGAPRYKIVSNLLFDYSGHVVLGLSQNGNLVVQPFPNSPNAQGTPRPKLVETGKGDLLAASWFNRSPTFVTRDASGLWLERHPADAERRLYSLANDAAPVIGGDGRTARLQPLVIKQVHTKGIRTPEFFFLDAAGGVWKASRNEKLERVATGIVAILSAPRFYTMTIGHGHDGAWQVSHLLQGMIHRRPGAGKHAFFGYGDGWRYPNETFVALEMNDGTWLIIDGKTDHRLNAPEGCEVVGAARTTLTSSQPALVWIDDDRQGITIAGFNAVAAPWRTSSPIAHATVSAVQPHIAWVTADGDLEVASLITGQKLFRSAIGEEPKQ